MPPVLAAAEDAEQLLADTWARSYGAAAVPIDPIWIARELGIEVYTARLEDDVSGVLFKGDDGIVEVYLNHLHSLVRQRFTCAHELGHYMSRQVRGLDTIGFIDRRDALSATGADPEERYANAFAASLLMPAPLVARLHSRMSVARLATEFNVSMEAMRIRLGTLGLS